MKSFYSALLLTLILYGCDQPNNKISVDSKETESGKTNVNQDSGYNVIKTTTLITANATKSYSTKNRKATQFALDKGSRQESSKNFIIKISDKKVLICDTNYNVLKDLSIIKQWTDKSGPSTVFDLKDSTGVEYSLDYYVDYQKKSFLGFRFSNSLETYTDE